MKKIQVHTRVHEHLSQMKLYLWRYITLKSNSIPYHLWYIPNQMYFMFQIRCTLCCNVAVSCLLHSYTCQITNHVVSILFTCQAIHIIDNMFFINMELFCRHIPQCTVYQGKFSGHVSNWTLYLCNFPLEHK